MSGSSIPERLEDSGGTRSGRAKFLSALSLALFASYSVYLLYLQTVRGSEYRSKATSIARQTDVISAQRGEIYDRGYAVPFVLNTDSFAVDLVPAELPAERRDEVFAGLARQLGMTVDEIQRRVPPSYYHLYQAIELRGGVPYETVTALAERIEDYPGVSWHSKPMRNYVETGSLSHVLGYVGDITKDELKLLYNQGYESGDVIGKAGIEKEYDSILRGKDGVQYRTVDVKGKKISSEIGGVDPPVMGSNVVLTIDAEIQRLSEKALGARMGSVVVLKPATGEILAMVSYPWYDPNLFTGTQFGKEYARLVSDPNSPLINRTLQSSYPPASTFKAVVTAGILEEKAFPVDKTVLCPGEITYGDRLFHCHIKKPGHGKENLPEALADSCDIYFWTVGRDNLGIERIVSYAKDFGYGKYTGIDLPNEVEGTVPTPQTKERRTHEKWLGGDTMNLVIGQGDLLVTPLQMADTFAMIVNDGVVYRPHILKEVRDPATGALIRSVEPEEILRSRTSKETFATLRDYLRGVVTDGTPKFVISTKATQVAGKTGTAEMGLKDRWHSWFAAYAPYGADADPKDAVVVVVMVEASNPWEWWAPYASNIILQGIFAHQDYESSIDALGYRYLVTKPQGRME
jgi:penicillin-binding protein 2